jgi:hypothetical protein
MKKFKQDIEHDLEWDDGQEGFEELNERYRKTSKELRAYVSDVLFEKATTKEQKLAAIFIHPILDDHDTGKDDLDM